MSGSFKYLSFVLLISLVGSSLAGLYLIVPVADLNSSTIVSAPVPVLSQNNFPSEALHKVTPVTSQNISSTVLNGSLPSSLQSSIPTTSSLLYYQTSTQLKSFFSTPQHLSYASPVNLSLRSSTDPVPYGLTFSSVSNPLAITNTTLLGSGAVGSTTYTIQHNPSFALTLDAQSSGGIVWNNFSIDSFSGQKLLNPLQADLVFNTSFSFLKKIIPADGIRYSFYIDFKFTPDLSLVSSPFPSILRLHLFYSSYYANYTLFPVSGSPALDYYLSSDSSINLVLNQSLLTTSQSLSIDFSRFFEQVSTDYHETSFIPYFNAFKTIEIGFFSTNSTLPRETEISFSQFQLYNKLLPADWFIIAGAGYAGPQQNYFSYPVSSLTRTFQNITDLAFGVSLTNKLLFDPALFFDNNFLIFFINTSFLKKISFHIASVNQQTILWQSSISQFPLQLADYLLVNPAVLVKTQFLYWYLNKYWVNVSVPTINNHESFPTGDVGTLQAVTALTSYQWFGGSLANDFSSYNFSISFQSSNFFSPYTIQGSIVDDLLNVSFSQVTNFNVSSTASLYTNESSRLVFFHTLSRISPTTQQLSFSNPIQSFAAKKTFFTLVAVATSPVVSVLYQSFSLQQLFSAYNNSFLCSNQFLSNSSSSDSFISIALYCSFDSSVLTPQYFNHVFISVRTLNASSLFQFSSSNLTAGVALFKTSIFIPLSVLVSTTNISLAYYVTYNSSVGNQVKWHNATYILFDQFNASSLPQQSDLYRYVPFYGVFSFAILSLFIYRKKRISKALHDQVS